MTRVCDGHFSEKLLLGVFWLIILAACSNRTPEPQRKSDGSAPAGQNSQTDQRVDTSQSIASGAGPSGPSEPVAPKRSTTSPKDDFSSQGGKPPAPTAGLIPESQNVNTAQKDVVLLNASLGTVRFEHKKHSEGRKIACETCHHASRPEHPAMASQEACSTCHTPTATPPMKTKLQAAFHNPTATAGTCIDCHKAENAKGKTAPVKCLGCHKKEAA
jgi:class III cytochrome C family protein